MNPTNWLRTRFIPAVITALGVTFLVAGMLSFTNPVTADPLATSSPTDVAVVDPTPSPLITLPPISSGAPTPTSSAFPADRVASRVRIAALKIDLPVIAPRGGYPPCDVAIYFGDERLGQPGQGRVTYLYGHARTGMFLPLLDASKDASGKKMIGMVVEVWTNDDQRFLYVITNVRRHVPYDEVFNKPFAGDSEQLWLQTSEGVGTQPKLQVVAEPLSNEPADHKEANPVAKPRNCA
ncbi:MAG: hypothetical protein E4H24_01395 [Thermomicrobiales bacterium]|nr:MAG: hypothetical protein E4H24_01395 [Thermomicrobiales bacterium]